MGNLNKKQKYLTAKEWFILYKKQKALLKIKAEA